MNIKIKRRWLKEFVTRGGDKKYEAYVAIDKGEYEVHYKVCQSKETQLYVLEYDSNVILAFRFHDQTLARNVLREAIDTMLKEEFDREMNEIVQVNKIEI